MKNAILISLNPSRYTKTRIMATIGPSSKDIEVLRDMVKAGVNCFRFNAAHIEESSEFDYLTYEQAREITNHIRHLRSEFRQLICLYFDLGGPKIRVLHVLGLQQINGRSASLGKWLRPKFGDTVILHSWDKGIENHFKKELTRFEDKHGRKINFNEGETPLVDEFFEEISQTKNYELMLGKDTPPFDTFGKGNIINLKDGWCQLKITHVNRTTLTTQVTYVDPQFEFRPGQGANPYRYIFADVITRKDERDIEVALRMGADIISLSFVCTSNDAFKLRDIIRQKKEKIRNDKKFMARQSDIFRRYISDAYQIPIFAKIETAFAVIPEEAKRYATKVGMGKAMDADCDPLSKIADAFDGLMVARGDLALEVSKEKIPQLQRKIIEIAHLKNRPVIVATEMLESMRRGGAPTRAEIDGINNAVHQEADILMLSGETASTKGKPVAAVFAMQEGIREAETERLSTDTEKNFEMLQKNREEELRQSSLPSEEISTSISRLAQGNQVCVSARALTTDVIIASAQLGQAVQEISYYRPAQKILAINDDILVGIRLLLHRGIYPVVMQRRLKRTFNEFIEIVNLIHKDIGIPVSKEVNGTFRVPGLVRIIPEFYDVPIETEIPNSIHEFTLPVEAKIAEETERKYVLSGRKYQILKKSLIKDAKSWWYVKQYNRYFTEKQRVLFNNRILLRVRIEKLIKFKNFPMLSPQRRIEVYFTWKGKVKSSDKLLKEEQREEKEFNITREFLGQFKIKKGKITPPVDFNKLPDYYRHSVVWNGFQKGLEERYGGPEKVEYIPIGEMENHRFSFEMPNGFVLELDETHYIDKRHKKGSSNRKIVEYELEIELSEHKQIVALLDEYIHDKFAYLDIPIVRVFEKDGYPSKSVQTYAHCGEIDRKVLDAVAEAKKHARKHHKKACDRCQ